MNNNLKKQNKKINQQQQKSLFQTVLYYSRSFLLFFGMNAFVVTCTFLLFGSRIDLTNLSREDIRVAAIATFFNVCLLTLFFMIVDCFRRKYTVDRPTKEIQKVLQQLMDGDFDARISVPYLLTKENKFKVISENINLLAEELASVETLRTDFIANVSHELKTPLAIMQNYGTLLQQPNLSEEQRIEYAKSITEASRRLANLITNILKLNKLENQQVFPSVKEYNLSEQLCECLLQFEDIWERKKLNIETDIEEDVMIHSDAELLSLVWNNLISNAMKFTEPEDTVSVSLKSDRNEILVTVADTGCGIAPEVGAHIFEKFYQGDTSHVIQGNGLGLALVKRVVDIMYGEISVESVKGEGSSFTVKIKRNWYERLEQ